ncbi:MAG: L-threonate dehydrogenase [Tropicimonas sp.]|uniref:L-threonate dehydrogenase n=1 Tax=Tropicimonas sp. TaxID=2067044 RepID=UPI003A85268C
MTKLNVAVIGLGSMGYGMAASVARAGHTTWGFDLDEEAMARFRAREGGQEGALPDIAADLDVVVIVVLNAAQTESVLFGEAGIVAQMKPGATVLACATVPPSFARDMEARCNAVGLFYVDAPISGGSLKAHEGSLTIMASARAEAFAAARPVLDATAETVFELGDCAGGGSAMKAVNQLLAGVHIAAMGEAITFGITQGVTPAKFVEVISRCAGTSWMLENRAPHVVEGDYTPRSSINIWPKDLGIVLDIAREAKFSAPITAAALQQYMTAAATGLGQEDDAAIAKVYARNAGVKLPGQA